MKNLLLSAIGAILWLSASSQTTVSTNGQKNPVLEEGTGTWTPFAPDGFRVSDDIKATSPNVIVLRHHSNDGMVNTQSQLVLSKFNNAGYPSASIDRKLYSPAQAKIYILRQFWSSAVDTQLQTSPTFDVTLTYNYNPATRVISATVTGKALTNLSGNYRTNLYIVEDSVIGTGSQYDQKNFYNTVSGHPYFGKGDPIVGLYHMNVVRDIMGGIDGTAAFTNPSANTTASNTYTYTVPISYNAYRIKLVATISKYNPSDINDNEIQNAVESDKNRPCNYPQPEVQICMVTRDTVSGKNLIVWEKAGIQQAKEYKIYRETSTQGTYQHIGTKASNQLSIFEDVNANPQTQSYRYKLTVVDSCNREMALNSADAHQTIHVSFNLLHNDTTYISWNPYIGKPYTTYTIKRSNNNGPFLQIAQVASTVTNYSDANPPTGVNQYRIEIDAQGSCAPTPDTILSTIISNTAVAWHTGVSNIESHQKVTIYPNPANNLINIEGVEYIESISISDITGRVIKTLNSTNGSVKEVNVSDLSNGTYLIKAVDKDGYYSIGKFQKM